jgi:hypothetical protein
MSITFPCACGKKLQVGDEFAGRRVKCPACAAVGVAPTPDPVFEVVEREPEAASAEDDSSPLYLARDPDDEPDPKTGETRRRRRRKQDLEEEGSFAAVAMTEARERSEIEERRARESVNDGGGRTMFGIHVTGGVLTGAGLLFLGTVALIALAFLRDSMGPRVQVRAFIVAIVFTGIGLVTLFRALMGEED